MGTVVMGADDFITMLVLFLLFGLNVGGLVGYGFGKAARNQEEA